LGSRIHSSLVTAARCPYELFGLSNPSVTRDSSSLLISLSIGAVWAVESMRQLREQFGDDF
jgi:hypothetical protein